MLLIMIIFYVRYMMKGVFLMKKQMIQIKIDNWRILLDFHYVRLYNYKNKDIVIEHLNFIIYLELIDNVPCFYECYL